MDPKLETAMFCEAFPCNPRPFAHGLLEYLQSGGTMTDKTAKRILFTLTGILTYQLFYFTMKEIMEKIGKIPRDSIEVLQEMIEIPSSQDHKKELLFHLILAAYKPDGYYDSTIEFDLLKLDPEPVAA